MKEINKIRKEIDRIDDKLSSLLKKRLVEIKKVAALKKASKSSKDSVQDKKREEEILEKLETEFEMEIFKKILRESREYQKASLTRKS
ncbi:chorismate mutase [Candidatus Peregrinibacteria bacterium]|jgi:chorismate mutase|nr:chorismate mutase [Candidatus Peregrinibacteria bacterium]MBT7736925.1 chorismate mutase [Candidatus Peregrinibacteria bacterium]